MKQSVKTVLFMPIELQMNSVFEPDSAAAWCEVSTIKLEFTHQSINTLFAIQTCIQYVQIYTKKIFLFVLWRSHWTSWNWHTVFHAGLTRASCHFGKGYCICHAVELEGDEQVEEGEDGGSKTKNLSATHLALPLWTMMQLQFAWFDTSNHSLNKTRSLDGSER